jgi:SpoIID/LytB domain protein
MQPDISIGILNAPVISFKLNGTYIHLKSNKRIEGVCRASLQGTDLKLECERFQIVTQLPFILEPECYNTASLDIYDVVIGKEFHWQRAEKQTFKGALKLIFEANKLTAVNLLPLEDYLLSVISSEMSATSSVELLKAHAVISRSWLLAQIQKGKIVKHDGDYLTGYDTASEHVKWYDREDHLYYDVCADDHCQRYQGITKASTAQVAEAVKATIGQVLAYDGRICDARFSKCCGGVTEQFENVWEPVVHPYLVCLRDSHEKDALPDLTVEANAEKWIKSSPVAFCNTNDVKVLSQVLNDYDRETSDFYRWKVVYSQARIQTLLGKKAGLQLGDIIRLSAIERGSSGRIILLKIEGSEGFKIIGKELEIRKALSESHLYSSAFVVETSDFKNGVPQMFTFTGAGWGHGVGLCQIGAAVMCARGYNYEEVLFHYFRGAELKVMY